MGLAVQDERLTTRVGAATLLVLALMLALLVVHDYLDARSGVRASVYFEYVGSLSEGAHVQVAGRPIGEVTSISLVPEQMAAAPEHPLHGTGGVAVNIRIDQRHVHMTTLNGEYFLSAKGFIGAPFVEIGPPADGSPPARPLVDGDRVRGVDAPRIDRAMTEAKERSQLIRTFFAELAPDIQELGRALDELGATLHSLGPTGDAVDSARASIRALRDEARNLAQAMEQGGLRWDQVEALADQASRTMARASALMTELRGRVEVLGQAFEQLDARMPRDLIPRLRDALARAEASLARVKQITAGVEELLAMIQRGQGTIGALLYDPEFSDDTRELGRMLMRRPWRLVGPPPAK